MAVGGDLKTSTLRIAYDEGIFPWFSSDSPILWWSPSNRCILRPDNFHISRRLKQKLRQNKFNVTSDKAFERVIHACASNRAENDTWITSDMINAYLRLHKEGLAHSIEVWEGIELVGGVYGVVSGAIFSGESMFSKIKDGSKIALAYLCYWMRLSGFIFLDCQIENPHLKSLGAVTIKRDEFVRILKANKTNNINWSFKMKANWD